MDGYHLCLKIPEETVALFCRQPEDRTGIVVWIPLWVDFLPKGGRTPDRQNSSMMDGPPQGSNKRPVRREEQE
jgi:hypothetical protein